MTQGKEIVCEQQQKLAENVQRCLIALAELAHAEREALRTRDEQLMLAIDKQIEETMGEKERGMGALRQHRAEHGC